jgi:HK97 gp10 family phage protein
MSAMLQLRIDLAKSMIRSAARRGVVRLAQELVRDIRKALNLPVEYRRVSGKGRRKRGKTVIIRSKPGEYPRKETGNLRKSIDWWEDPDAIAAEVGANVDAPYWSDLEYGTVNMAPRPFIRPRVQVMRREASKIIGGEIKISLGG